MIIQKSELAPKLKAMKSMVGKSSLIRETGVLVKNRTMTANSGNMALTAALAAEEESPFVLPTRAIELIENLPDGPIEITPRDHQITIKADKIKNSFQSIDPSIYPEWSEKPETDGQAVTLEGKDLHEALNSILYACAPNTETKRTMTGVSMACEGDGLNLVACDGYRLAWHTIPYESPINMIVPKEAIQKLLQMDLSGQVEVICNNTATFKLEGYTLMTRLIEGPYLDYKKHFPQYDRSIIVNRRALIASVSRAEICADEEHAKVVLSIEGSTIIVKSQSPVGAYTEELPTENPIAEPIKIAFNSRYLLDCLKSYQCENLEVALGSSLQPMVTDDGHLKSMVLPVREY